MFVNLYKRIKLFKKSTKCPRSSRVPLPLLLRLYQRAHIAATRGTEYVVVYMFQSLAHAETAEENNLLRRKQLEIVKRREDEN